jgi:hypothetical protein
MMRSAPTSDVSIVESSLMRLIVCCIAALRSSSELTEKVGRRCYLQLDAFRRI